jgi:hypothetical protein
VSVAFTKLQVGLFAAHTSAISIELSPPKTTQAHTPRDLSRPKVVVVCNAAIDVAATFLIG